MSMLLHELSRGRRVHGANPWETWAAWDRASHIFRSAAKGHNEEVSMTTTFVVTSCQSWELARAKNSMAR